MYGEDLSVFFSMSTYETVFYILLTVAYGIASIDYMRQVMQKTQWGYDRIDKLVSGG